MADPVNLNDEVARAINGALLRGRQLALAYVREDGEPPAVSFRGSTHVHSPTELAFWARKRDDGLAVSIAERPQVALVFFEPNGEAAKYLAIEGHARIAPELDDEVYAAIPEPERNQDPERKGVAVVITVDKLMGMGSEGFIQQSA